MWRYATIVLALVLPGAPVAPLARPDRAAPEALAGRWDITIHAPEKELPSWLEIWPSGSSALVGQFVGVVGSARPISRVEVRGDSLRFSIPPQWEEGTSDLTVEGRVQGDRLTGSMTMPDGKRYDWTASRAPLLRPTGKPAWGAPQRLFNGTDLTGWRAVGDSRWSVTDGVLHNSEKGGNLVTDGKFTDFRLHLELRFPRGSNSGVYLRGRHEVQVADSLSGEPPSERLGAIYGFLAPSADAARAPGEWQSLDITLRGRMVTVVANGRTVVCNREIPGITGGALDSDEGAPGPLLLQGDHGPVEFRNIVLTPAR
jgi:hypothetical protein